MWDAIEKHKSITNGAEALIYVETSAERIFAKYKELYNSFYEDIGQYLDKKGKERSLANYVNEDLYNFWILYLRCVSKVRPKKQRLVESFSEFTARHSNNDL